MIAASGEVHASRPSFVAANALGLQAKTIYGGMGISHMANILETGFQNSIWFHFRKDDSTL